MTKLYDLLVEIVESEDDRQTVLSLADEIYGAEIERLTVDNQRLTELWDTDRESLNEEIARLRLEPCACACHTIHGQNIDAEIERLRAALDMVAEEREAWKAKAEQLREELPEIRARLDEAERVNRMLDRTKQG